jgi:hypothetical protein
VHGDKVSILLTSGDFDAYLVLFPPTGEPLQCDNYYSAVDDAELPLTLPETGEYELYVTTAESEETGYYVLSIDFE